MSQVIKKSDLELILSGAAALQARELTEQTMQELEGIAEEETDELPMSVVYEFAQDAVGIPQEYVERYIQIKFPSRERKIGSANGIGAKPTEDSVIKTYSKELLDSLRKSSPLETFELKSPNSFPTFYRVAKMTERGLFGRIKRIKSKDNLAYIFRAYSRMVIYDSFFTEACKEKIEELQRLFRDSEFNITDIRYDYPI